MFLLGSHFPETFGFSLFNLKTQESITSGGSSNFSFLTTKYEQQK
jgi:hypothetical protein